MAKKNHGNKEAKKPKREAPVAKPPLSGVAPTLTLGTKPAPKR